MTIKLPPPESDWYEGMTEKHYDLAVSRAVRAAIEAYKQQQGEDENVDCLTIAYLHGFAKGKDAASAQPAQQGEAVAQERILMQVKTGDKGRDWVTMNADMEDNCRAHGWEIRWLVVEPAPAQQPLSEEQEREAFEKAMRKRMWRDFSGFYTLDGVRAYCQSKLQDMWVGWLSRAHGIGGEKP
jgi:hypothetical protein